METNVGFTQIGLTAALILNRLRNQQRIERITNDTRGDEECGRGDVEKYEDARSELANKRRSDS